MTGPSMRALTVAQPWAWCIAHAGKTVENRSWNTTYRGPVAIHAARRYDPYGARAAARLAGALPDRDGMVRGAVIAVAELVEVHTCDGHCSPWAVPGAHHFVLDHIRAIDPIPARGALGLWRVPDHLLALLEA